MNSRKLLKKMLGGSKNVRFDELVALLEALGFSRERTTGSHCIFEHLQVNELVNIQNWKGKAKPYQVRQVLNLIELHNLKFGEES